MKIFISGGCKNGKSYYAQKLAMAQRKKSLYYIATMRPADKEDDLRIIRHKEERKDWGFETIECPEHIENILNICSKDGSFLLDSLTALLSNEMFSPEGKCDFFAFENIKKGLGKVYKSVEDIVVVSDYIYSDAFIYDDYTEGYRRSLACLDRFCAEQSDIVIECVFSSLIIHKGKKEFEMLYEKISSFLF
ncbi:bifunctional adenosylcobinamide kinase/adenosylcobinamide-phosphate guanylyltransferase [Anaeropeptidivorans aminofermentans]|jgi:adenosylcobinamide kinase/adenosylcobinamide-phosphate guanylyltransferase|uniref:bifunctional adenosylcobinamide kinase/adenosylcobinamide-phosphate guanylyltransferase n=1 Tax=Anaeropeptidivorans aminofermentans TaxID=2934315 RepID=UPI002024FA0A|nr:bifunctional adenosylcobinamide kinase/adenosylcobinamide-phosphate guanylyltransferase [Anaeropeptidivorans aminofermentans]